MIIKSLKAREILDSRGVPTVEAVLETNGGIFKGACPSGTSAGKHEAIELRDKEERFFGKGVLKAVKNIETTIALAVVGKEFESQKEFDNFLINLDGTENKSNLGANAVLPVSIAFCRALACENQMPLYQYIAKMIDNKNVSLPRPCFNILEGGKHAGNNLEVQEFMAVPFLDKFSDNLKAGAEVYYQLKMLLIKNFGETSINTGYEAGFAPPFKKTEMAFEFLLQAFQKAGYEGKFKVGVDIAATELLYKEKYKVNGKLKSPEKLCDYYIELCKKYPIVFIEDGFGEDDFANWHLLKLKTESEKLKIVVVGDDLTVTNPKRIQMAKEQDLCNGMILKLNQIGSVWEGIEAFLLTKSFGWKVIVSHRSGETNDDFIADFAVGVGADFIKTGAPAGGERVAKYNRLLEIEKLLDSYQSNF